MTHPIQDMIYINTVTVADSGAMEQAARASSDFLISPWLGLIGLAVLVVTGAVAVIHEIQVEKDDVPEPRQKAPQTTRS
ncbi:hypothetical protein [Ponticaulis profundi]|uniref:Uncharacterized protein n=1 Tax=Ponticaulis profundi TaxID=2665222 RepID=A0ABW1S513_9PROT